MSVSLKSMILYTSNESQFVSFISQVFDVEIVFDHKTPCFELAGIVFEIHHGVLGDHQNQMANFRLEVDSQDQMDQILKRIDLYNYKSKQIFPVKIHKISTGIEFSDPGGNCWIIERSAQQRKNILAPM